MRTHLTLLFSLLASGSVVAASLPRSVEYSCKYEVKSTCTRGMVMVELSRDQIQKFDYVHTACSPTSSTFDCFVDAERDNKQQQWKEEKDFSEISFSDSYGPVRISQLKDGVFLDFKERRSTWNCGANTLLPIWVFVPFKSHHCRVKFGRI